MGKYMHKGKVSDEVAVVEVSQQTPLGVRTRARTLALQRLQKPPSPPSPDPSFAYLELRSRRLEKPPPPPPDARPKEGFKAGSAAEPISPRGRRGAGSGSVGSVSASRFSKPNAAPAAVEEEELEASPEVDGGVEVSFGENVLEAEATERSTRETTPCSLIRDSDAIGTPGSTTRPANSTAGNRRRQSSTHRNIPTAREMEEFFIVEERSQQEDFMEKYNFDPINDHPLPGRYEWVKLDRLAP